MYTKKINFIVIALIAACSLYSNVTAEKRLFLTQEEASKFKTVRDIQSKTGKTHSIAQHPSGHFVVEIEPMHHTETRRFVTQDDANQFCKVRNARGFNYSPVKVGTHYEVTIDANA